MFDFKKCIEADNGKVYCFDTLKKKWIELDIRYIQTKDVPSDAIDKFAEAVLNEEIV